MQSLYSLSMYLFGAFLRIGARFNAKAKLWTEGRRDLFARIRSDLETISPERRSRTTSAGEPSASSTVSKPCPASSITVSIPAAGMKV